MVRGHNAGAVVPYWFATEAIYGAGGLRSNVQDMLTYLKAKMTVNEAGDLSVPGLGTVSALSLYRSALNEERHFDPRVPGPWTQFRR